MSARSVLPNQGLVRLLRLLLDLDGPVVQDWKLRLFVNDVNPSRSSTFGSFTAPSWGGYGDVDIDPTKWTAPVLVANAAHSVYDTTATNWTNGGGVSETVYGYIIFDPAGNLCLKAERFSEADVQVVAPGGVVSLFPVLDLGTQLFLSLCDCPP